MDNPGANPGGQREFGDKGKRVPAMDELPGRENLELIRIARLFRVIPEVQPVGFGSFQGSNPLEMEGIGSVQVWDSFVVSGRYLGYFCLFHLEKPWKRVKDQPRDEPGTATPSQILNTLSHFPTSDLS